MANNAFTIQNACNIPLNAQQGTIPNVGAAILDWLQPLTFTLVTKATVAFNLIETATVINFWGTVQPSSGRQLNITDDGQRKWNYIKVIAQCAPADALVTLSPDDVIIFSNVQYRVMGSRNYSLYGFIEMDLCEDYVGEGPPTP